MREGSLYKEAADHGFALVLREGSARLISHTTQEVTELVNTGPEGPIAVIPAAWEADFARRIARGMKPKTERSDKGAKRKTREE